MVEAGIRYLFQAKGEVTIKDDNGLGLPLIMTDPYMELRYVDRTDTRKGIIPIECHFWEVTGRVAITFEIPNLTLLDISVEEISVYMATDPFLSQFVNIPIADIQTHIDARLLAQGKKPDGSPIND